MAAVPKNAADLCLYPAPPSLGVNVVLEALCFRLGNENRQGIGLIAIAKLRDEIGPVLALLPILEIPAEIPGWPPQIEALEQPFLDFIAPFHIVDGSFRILLPPAARQQRARKQTARHFDGLG